MGEEERGGSMKRRWPEDDAASGRPGWKEKPLSVSERGRGGEDQKTGRREDGSERRNRIRVEMRERREGVEGRLTGAGYEI